MFVMNHIQTLIFDGEWDGEGSPLGWALSNVLFYEDITLRYNFIDGAVFIKIIFSDNLKFEAWSLVMELCLL